MNPETVKKIAEKITTETARKLWSSCAGMVAQDANKIVFPCLESTKQAAEKVLSEVFKKFPERDIEIRKQILFEHPELAGAYLKGHHDCYDAFMKAFAYKSEDLIHS